MLLLLLVLAPPAAAQVALGGVMRFATAEVALARRAVRVPEPGRRRLGDPGRRRGAGRAPGEGAGLPPPGHQHGDRRAGGRAERPPDRGRRGARRTARRRAGRSGPRAGVHAAARRCVRRLVRAPAMPAKPRWLLAIPDAIRQLEGLDRDLLTRRDVERLFGVSRARAATLMRTFGAELTGYTLTLPRAELLRQLRLYRKRGVFRAEEQRRARLVTELRKARLTGILGCRSRPKRCRGGCRGCRTACWSNGTGSKSGSAALPRRCSRGGAAVVCAGSGADARLRALRSGRQRGGDSGRRVRLQGPQGPAVRGAGGDVITRPRDAARPSTFRGSHRVGSGQAKLRAESPRRLFSSALRPRSRNNAKVVGDAGPQRGDRAAPSRRTERCRCASSRVASCGS